jgi:hypothetical protein
MKHSLSAAGLALVAWPAIAVSQAPRTITYPAVAPNAITTLATPSLTLSQAGCELNGVNGVVLQRSGGIVVANAGDRQFCYFDAGGQLIKKFGRRGAGPGEFDAPEVGGLYRGDSIVVADRMQRRVTVLGPRGEGSREFVVTRPDSLGSHTRTLALPNGDLLLSFSEVTTMAPRPEAVTFYQQFFRMNPSGAPGPRVVRLVEGERFVQGLKPEDGMGSTAYWGLQWGRSTSYSATATGFVAGDGGDNVIRQYDTTGQVRVLHVVPLARRPITPELIAAYKKTVIGAARPERRPVTERMANEMPYPKETPAYSAIIADQSGPIWVQSYPDSSGAYWLRLDPATASAKAFKFPAKFRLYAVRSDRACGVGRDEDDLQTIYCFAVPR